jgi:hypothetical protein
MKAMIKPFRFLLMYALFWCLARHLMIGSHDGLGGCLSMHSHTLEASS